MRFNKRNNIYLIGMMGVGKTTLGKHLAKATGLTFVDCDKAIEDHTGTSIKTIFEFAGEPGFRKLEQQLLLELVQRDNIVLSSGGGVVLNPDNRAALRANGYVVYLSATLGKLLKRTVNNSNRRWRPLLNVDNPEQQLRILIKQREPLYRQIADTVIDVRTYSPQVLIKKIIREYAKNSG